ncbi:MAG: ABC exporter membrane fusion protein [Scytonema sp. RU_4_4]|nr:ABC exporter membrane fusion protein [Scytonema sp. RU_4_4]NJR72525.1 ABC exporter membrane fusion protein [Scytonema sp. CRU_2_7]
MSPWDVFIKSISRQRVGLAKPALWAIIGALFLSMGSAIAYWQMRSPSTQANPSATMTAPMIKTVTALGWLEPDEEVIHLKAPTSSQESRIDQLLVKVGDRVQKGQVIAILDSRDRLQASFYQAQKDVQVARTKLVQVKAGAKEGEIATQQAEIARLKADRQASIAAQQATVERLQSEVQNAEVEYQRYEMLYQQGAVSASQHDSKKLTLQTAQRNLKQVQAELTRLQSTRSPELDKAQATLEKIREVRPVDVAVSQAELEQAIAAATQAKASLEQAYVRSPQDGVVMDIHTRAGEVISEDGIVEIGQTNQMMAIAQVYESDIRNIHPGQTARISSNALPSKLQGTVAWIDQKVRQQTVINTDPSQNIDAKIIEVHIRLDPASSQKAAKFTNLQVEVQIER